MCGRTCTAAQQQIKRAQATHIQSKAKQGTLIAHPKGQGHNFSFKQGRTVHMTPQGWMLCLEILASIGLICIELAEYRYPCTHALEDCMQFCRQRMFLDHLPELVIDLNAPMLSPTMQSWIWVNQRQREGHIKACASLASRPDRFAEMRLNIESGASPMAATCVYLIPVWCTSFQPLQQGCLLWATNEIREELMSLQAASTSSLSPPCFKQADQCV